MKVILMKKNNIVVYLISSAVIFALLISIIATKAIYSMNTAKEVDGIKVPIIMYHCILKDKSKTNKYVITPSSMENDFAYLKSHGYQTVFVSDLINYVYNNGTLPEKPVIITYDDGYLNNMTYALPLLEKYEFKAVISIVGEFTDTFTKTLDRNPNYAYLTWEDIGTLLETKRIEIGNHTYAMHTCNLRKGCKKLKKETNEQYQKILAEDLSELQNRFKEKFGTAPVTFTYPYGYISKESYPVIRSLGFEATLSCKEAINYITKSPECLFNLGRFNRDGKLTTEKFMQKLIN